jgi:hypothetical protein
MSSKNVFGSIILRLLRVIKKESSPWVNFYEIGECWMLLERRSVLCGT